MKTTEPRGIHRRTEFTVTHALQVRFERMVNRQGPDDCWLWTGALRNGYGAIKHEKKVLSAHVVALAIAGFFPEPGQVACHSCDTRMCCNPSHLAYKSFADNNAESRDRNEAFNIASGESAYNAILTDEIVCWIRAHKLVNGYGRKRMARMLGESASLCKGAYEGWKHASWPSVADAASIINARSAESVSAELSARRASLGQDVISASA